MAKLPFTTKCPCDKRDETDSWNYPQLEKFKACSVTSLRNVQYRTRQLESIVEQEKVREFEKYKKSLAEQEKAERDEKLKNKRPAARPAAPPIPTPTPPAVPVIPRPVTTTVRVSLPVANSEDAFVRNQQDIRPFVRAFWKEQRRFPTTDETLDWLKANSRYSGEWEDGESKRAKRVGQILAFTEQSFDPKKMSQGEHQPVSLQVGRFSWWVRQHIGSVLTGHIANLREFDPVAMTVSRTEVSVPAKFVETFLVVADFCLQQDPLDNKAVPTNRIKKLWKMVTGGAAWNQQYFQIVRERLHRMGIIRIFDRQHHSGKAWRWEASDSFPADDYRKEQRKLRERSRLRTGVAGKLS